MGSTRSGVTLTGTGRGAEADLLASAAALRWSRPDLTAALADHVLETAVAEDDLDRWLRAAGWAVHGHSATGDGRVVASEVLDALSRWGGEPLSNRAAHRLRVELAVLAAAAGEVQGARGLLEPVMVDEVPAGLRADAYCALARCASEDSPADVAAELRRAESAWSDVAALRADVGIAAVALVAAATARRAGRTKRAVERAAEGLERLDRGRGAAQTGTPSGHLSAALAAEWISALLDAGRLDEARTACEPWVTRLQGNIRPSRQVARLRITVAHALATGPAAEVTDALEKAALDAAASDAPDLESVCHSALGALYEQSGGIDAALESMRLGVAAQLRDSKRASAFLEALRSVVPPAPAATRSADRGAGGGQSPRSRSRAEEREAAAAGKRSRSRSAHERPESADRIDADIAAADPWSTGRWSTSTELDAGADRGARRTERNGNGWGGLHGSDASSDVARHGGGRNGSSYDSPSEPASTTAGDTSNGVSTGGGLESLSVHSDRYESARADLERFAAELTGSISSSDDRFSLSAWERLSRDADRAAAPAAEESRVENSPDSFASDWSSDWSSSRTTERASRDTSSEWDTSGWGSRASDEGERTPTERNGTERSGSGRNGSARKSTESGAAASSDTERSDTERSGTERNGRGRNGKSRNGAETSRSDRPDAGRPDAGGRRRRSAEPVEPVAERRPLEMPEIDTNAEGWLQSALAELDRVWGPSAGSEPATAHEAAVDPLGSDPIAMEPVEDSSATGCTVVIDVARDGRRFAGRRARAVVRDLTERLSDRLPEGARLRQEDNDALAVVLPGWDQTEATQWMHRTLTGLLEGFTAAEDLVGAQLRAGVHNADGPVGAQLVQRLDAAPVRRSDAVALDIRPSSRRSSSESVRADEPSSPREDRWADLDVDHRYTDDVDTAPERAPEKIPERVAEKAQESERDSWPELGSPSRRTRDSAPTRGTAGRHDAGGRKPFRLEEHLGRGVERERVERARDDASRHRRPSDTGALPAVQPSRGASDTGSTRAVTAERPGEPDGTSTEGLGLADLLAGALAAYRGI